MPLTFEKLEDSKVEQAFELLSAVSRKVKQAGRIQRIANTTLPTYKKWQSEAANFVVMEDREIVGVVTLRNEVLIQWPGFVELGPVPMMRALATHPSHSGKGVGVWAVKQLLDQNSDNNPVFLDCVIHFLPEFYSQFGFVKIAEQTMSAHNGNDLEIVLMKRNGSENLP